MHKCYEPGIKVTLQDDRDIKFITIPAREEHTATIIWLHGLGRTGKYMLPHAMSLVNAPALAHVKVVLPYAPKMRVTNLSAKIPSWFDYYSSDVSDREEDEEGLYLATRWINSFIAMEGTYCGIPPEQIIVGGLSQGGAVSLLTGITARHKFAGIFALGTYIPLRTKTQEIISPFFSSIPIFWGHGKMDAKVDHSFALSSVQSLAIQLEISFRSFNHSDSSSKSEFNDAGAPEGIEFHSYETLGHEVGEREVEDLKVWVKALLSPKILDDRNKLK